MVQIKNTCQKEDYNCDVVQRNSKFNGSKLRCKAVIWRLDGFVIPVILFEIRVTLTA